jgi:hypothetical protein
MKLINISLRPIRQHTIVYSKKQTKFIKSIDRETSIFF